MVNRDSAWNPEGRQLVVKRFLWFQSALDVLSVIFWNQGPLKIVHATLSMTLICVWLGLPILWVTAAWTSGGKREWLSGLGTMLVTCLAFASAFKLAALTDSKDWDWYMWEWICISFQGIGMIVTGAGLPGTYKLRFGKSANGMLRWNAELEGRRRLIRSDDLE